MSALLGFVEAMADKLPCQPHRTDFEHVRKLVNASKYCVVDVEKSGKIIEDVYSISLCNGFGNS